MWALEMNVGDNKARPELKIGRLERVNQYGGD